MSGQMPNWFATWLGLQPAVGGGIVTWQLESTWSWAPWATLLLIIGAVLWTAALYRREASSASPPYRALLAILRIASVVLLLVMIAQLAIAVRISGPPTVAVVIDRSASMSIADQFDEPGFSQRLQERLIAAALTEPTRLSLAKLLLTAEDGHLINELMHRYRTELYAVARGLEHIKTSENKDDIVRAIRDLQPNAPDSDSTRLGDNLTRVLDDHRSAPPSAIVLLTDGVNTESRSLADAAREARRQGVPIFSIGIGRDSPPRDIELADVLVDDVVFVNDLVSIQVQVKASGLEGQPAKLALRREGSPDVISDETIKLPANGSTLAVRLTDQPTTPGTVTYVVEIEPRDDEIDQQNNRRQRLVSVRDEKIRVLLAYGYPSYEFRFLKTLLERDSTIQLATFLQDADPDYVEQDKTAIRTFPVSREETLAYDLLVIGDIDPRLLPRGVWANIRAFVAEKGGGAVFIAGPRFLPWLFQGNSEIAGLLPIEIDQLPSAQLPQDITRGFTMRPTALGLQSPLFQMANTTEVTEIIWQNLAPQYWLFPITKLKPGAQVLAEGPASAVTDGHGAYPAICFQYVGAGRVLFHAIDSTWRWRTGGGAWFARYWVQAIRFLSRGKLSRGRAAEITVDRREYNRGEIPQIRVRFPNAQAVPSAGSVRIAVEARGQDPRTVELHRNHAVEGLFEGAAPGLPVGTYEMTLAEPALPGVQPKVRFAVVAPPGEFARTEMDSNALAAAAEMTHGKFYRFAQADQLMADLPAGRPVPLENLPPISIWNRWWTLSAFLACLTAEWILRKRKGML